MELTYIKDASQPVGDAGDDYIGFDRFGRTVDMNWRKTVGGSELDHIQYGYNRASNRTWRKNLVAASGQDEAYKYDGLYQLSDFSRGNLNINRTGIGAIPETEEQFTYDPTGNWQAYIRKSDGSVDLDQTRVNNKDNQITQIDDSSDGIAHDLAGNTTQMPPDASGDWSKSLTITWDAWNRIVKVEDGATEVGAYQYDGLYRRTTKTVSGVIHHTYYSNRWKSLEERIDTSTDAERQYLWGARPLHRDELILRDRKTGAPPVLDERLYCTMDYFNPTAAFDKLGVVQERYGFSGFGIRSVLAPDFTLRTASNFGLVFAFHGQFLDDEISFYNYGFRSLSPAIGSWMSRDPIEEIGALSLYQFAEGDPTNLVDMFGLEPVAEVTPVKKQCTITLIIAHGGNRESNHPSADALDLVANRCNRTATDRFGAIGCNTGTFRTNQDYNRRGVGVPNIPSTKGSTVGPASPNNAGYGRGIPGFKNYLNAAFDAAKDQADTMCDDPDCCTSVLIEFACQGDTIGVMRNAGLEALCGKSETCHCEDRSAPIFKK